MTDVVIVLSFMFPVLVFIAYRLGWAKGYCDAKKEVRTGGCVGSGSAGLGRGVTLGQLSVRKKGGVR